jgi:hypothetical protein
MLAPVCSSWIWLCRSYSKRSRDFPMGDTSREWVRAANCMVTRVCLILYILSARRVWWILEQPVSSVLQYHDRFQEFLKTHRVYRTYMCMGPYGAATLKPSYLYSQHELTEQLKQDRAGFTPQTQLVTRSVAGHVTGNANLKGSQAYPSRFGSAIEKLYTKHYTTLATNAAIMAASDHNPVTIADILDAVIVNKDCLHCMHMCTCKHACKHACTPYCSYACTCLTMSWCGTAYCVNISVPPFWVVRLGGVICCVCFFLGGDGVWFCAMCGCKHT